MKDDALKKILENWIDSSLIQRVEQITTGATHKTYKISLPSNHYYFRIYKYQDEQRIKREHDLLRILEKTSVPAVRVIVQKEGASFSQISEQYCALYDEVGGTQLDKSLFSISHAREAAIALANVHKTLITLDYKNYSPIRLKWNGEQWAERFDKIIGAIRYDGLATEIDLWAMERSRAQQEWLRNKECVHQYECIFPSQIIHGDYQHHNLFFGESGSVSGIIDWDSVMLMPRAYEILRSCAFMFDMETSLSEAFISTYRNYNPIEINELEDGAKAWGCFSDHHVWPLEETYIHKNISASTFIPFKKFTPFRDQWTALKNAL